MKDTFNPEQKRRLMELAGITTEAVYMGQKRGVENLTDQDRETIREILPKYLFHATRLSDWEKIKQAGYLGYEYTEDRQMSARRGYQPLGVGVFLATSPEGGDIRGGLNYRTKKSEDKVIIKVPVSVLDLDKLTIDTDGVDASQLFPYRKKFNLKDYADYLESFFYQGKINLKDITFRVIDEAARDRENFNTFVSEINTYRKVLEPLGVPFPDIRARIEQHVAHRGTGADYVQKWLTYETGPITKEAFANLYIPSEFEGEDVSFYFHKDGKEAPKSWVTPESIFRKSPKTFNFFRELDETVSSAEK